MGGSLSSVIYSIPITSAEEAKGESQVYRNPRAKYGLNNGIPGKPEIQTYSDVILNTVKEYSSNKFLGTREAKSDGTLGGYNWKTYQEVFEIVKELGSGINELGLAPKIKEFEDMELRFVACCSKNREEYLILDLATSIFGMTLVPIYDTLGPESVNFVFTQTNLTTVFCSGAFVDNFIKDQKAGKNGRLSTIVVFDPIKEEQHAKAKEANIKLLTWADVLKAGEKKNHGFVKVTPDSIYTFSYTSGTTGTPKAAMLTHRNIVCSIGSSNDNEDARILSSDIHLSYLPLAHVMERLFSALIVSSGASIGFFNGDVQKLKDDLAILKPTVFISVPRLFNRFHDAMKSGINKLTGIKKSLADRAIEVKLSNLKNEVKYTHSIYDALVFKKTKESTGGRCRLMCTGSAPISAEVLDFLRIALCCPIMEGYGQTESTGASFLTSAADSTSGHVGGPMTCLEFKVQDVHEMNYTSKDRDAQGNLVPRGEICLKGPQIFKGYYKAADKTAETFDKDGWLHTGDIGQIHPNGSLKIIDRKKNIFKLAIGEYIAAEKIENIYLRSKYIAEAFIYGDSLQHYLIVFIVPDPKLLGDLASKLGVGGSLEDICKNEKVKAAVLDDANKIGKTEGKLLSFELAKKIHLEPVSFVILDLMTPSFKMKRHDAKLKYKTHIEEMYASTLEEPVKK
jgi:long-chain acyl-CoA synthetase